MHNLRNMINDLVVRLDIHKNPRDLTDEGVCLLLQSYIDGLTEETDLYYETLNEIKNSLDGVV